MALVKLIFYFSVATILYPYIIYPIVLKIISVFKSDSRIKDSDLSQPSVSLIISAYNEEEVIEDKISNSLSLNYPKHLLEIAVVSDGSTDRTNEIVRQYANRGVILRHYDGRIGKSTCLNRAVPLAGGEIIIFTDANSKFDKDAVKELVKNFADQRIGFVTGHTRYTEKEDKNEGDSIGFYSMLERKIKSLESRVGSCVGADGAIFAVRKPIYQPLKDSDINDLVIPLNVIKQGYKGKFEESAFCAEQSAGSAKGEFNRQVRITTRTIRAIFNYISLLNLFSYGLFSFEFFSHKVLRLFIPFFMTLTFISNLFLISQGYFYALTFIIQLFFYLTAWLKYKRYSFNGILDFFSAGYTFITVNLAILWGWVKFMQGETFTAWQPIQR